MKPFEVPTRWIVVFLRSGAEFCVVDDDSTRTDLRVAMNDSAGGKDGVLTLALVCGKYMTIRGSAVDAFTLTTPASRANLYAHCEYERAEERAAEPDHAPEWER